MALDAAQHLPLGIVPDERYTQATAQLEPSDCLLLYTDGVTEAHNPLVARRELFGLERLDEALHCPGGGAEAVVDAVVGAVERFTGGQAPADDRTLLVACVTGAQG